MADKKTPGKKVTENAKLKKELLQSRAHDIGTLNISHREIAKCGQERFMASGVIISITDNGGKTLIEPTMIQDGLSAETIAAIKADIKRTFDLRMAYNTIKE